MGRAAGIEGEICIAELAPEFIADQANTLARLAASQRYWGLRQGAEDVPAVLRKERPPMTENYQLLAHGTSLVLVKERTDAQRARHMPGIRSVQAMLAAGWGGQSSVNARAGARRLWR